MNYRLIAIDLDGTLLDPGGRISAENRKAIAAAQAAGVLVVPCTGRAWHESRAALAPVPDLDVGVFATGATVTDVSTGACADHAPIEPDVALEVVEILRGEPEAVLALRESSRAGHDYLVTGDGEPTENTLWWFEQTEARVRRQPRVSADDLQDVLRLSVVAPARRMDDLKQRVAEQVNGHVYLHAFGAIQMPDPDQSVHILEVFAAGVEKWRGLDWIAARRGIGDHEIAAIGDEINDASMLRAAGCGVAMANAVEQTRSAADRVTASNEHHGVAEAIYRMLEGQW